MKSLFDNVSFKISELVTHSYSTSFSIAVSLLEPEIQKAIVSIYGFVRFADEIVDSFYSFDREKLLLNFEKDYYIALNDGISLNPILHSFQQTVKKYNIPDELVQAFLTSMKADLYKHDYKNKSEIDGYIYGSADVVGLMCLKVFCNGEEKSYKMLETPAMKLGSAFQKVNFLRDLKNDMELLNRHYFPNIEKTNFNNYTKNELINEIEIEFSEALEGIKKLPGKSRIAVLIAYNYYKTLLKKIKATPANKILETRIRISNFKKIILLLKSYCSYKLNLI